MKWNLHNEYIESIPKKELNKQIEKAGISPFIIDMIIKNRKNNDSITLLTDNKTFLEKTVKKLVALCYERNIHFDTAMDNHKCIYQTDLELNQTDNEWCFTVNKVSFNSNRKMTICYYFNFVNQNRNFHLTMMLDENMV